MRRNKDVRFTPESGHVQCNRPCPLWAKSGLYRSFLALFFLRRGLGPLGPGSAGRRGRLGFFFLCEGAYQKASRTDASTPTHQTSMLSGMRETAVMLPSTEALPVGASSYRFQGWPPYQ